MASFDRHGEWQHWAGTLDEIEQAVAYAVSRVQQWSQHGKPRVKINLLEASGLTAEFDAMPDLREGIDPRDVSDIISLQIAMGFPASRSEIQLVFGRRFSLDPRYAVGCRYSVSAPDREAVESTAGELDRLLKPRHRLSAPGINRRNKNWAAFAAFAIGADVFFWADWPVNLIGGLGAGAGFASLVLATAWASPWFELLKPGDRPKFMQYRAKLSSATAALVIGVASSLVVSAIGV